jgi:hypothetical protein
MVTSILGSGVAGIQRGIEGLRKDAQAIASANVKQDDGGVADLAAPLVDLKVNLHQVQASARVIETVDEILTFLLRANSDKP